MAKKPNADTQIMNIEVGEYVNLKSQLEAYKLGELITLPKFLNVRDYNGLCAYLKEQREYLMKEPAEVPELIEVPEPNESPIDTESESHVS